MRRKFLKLSLPLITMMALVFSVTAFAATGTIDAVDDAGTEQATFYTTDDVYVSGTCENAANQNVDIYVVDSPAFWIDDDIFYDVRSGVTNMTIDPSGDIPVTLLWENPLDVGQYDIVIDIDKDGRWDEATEDCFDQADDVGFAVEEYVAPTEGTVAAAKGADDPGDHDWILGEGDADNIMMELELSADDFEDVDVTELVLTATGNGDESVGIAEVKIVEDADDDGAYDMAIDFTWANEMFSADDETLTFPVTGTITADSTVTLLVIFVMSEDAVVDDTYSFTLDSVTATGATSAATLAFAELPMDSGVKTVVAAPEVCEGPLTLALDPETAEPEAAVVATVSGLANCETVDIEVKTESCEGTMVCTATSTDGADGECTFNAPAEEGTTDYYACYDYNDDTDMEDDGETAMATLTVEEEVVEPEPGVADPFTDIEGHWAEDYIEDLREKGIVGGKEPGVFDPNASITRAELTKMALLAFGHDVPEEDDITEKPFEDVEIDQWYARFITKAKEVEIVEGYEDGTFKPNDPINRVEVLKILLEAAGVDISVSPSATFPDTEEDAWYAEYLNYAIENAVVGGYTGGEYDGMFRPGHTATRAEVAKMISILLTILEEAAE